MLLIDTQEPQRDADEASRRYRAERRRQRLRDAGLFFGILSIVAGIVLAVLLAPRGPLGDGGEDTDEAAAVSSAAAPAPTAAEAGGVKFEKFERVDPALPAIPPGAVKRFKVDVYEHLTKVSDELAPLEVWSYAINGVEHRGTGVSEPMVVEVGDNVQIDLVNGSGERMHVRMPHSIDFHSSEVNPGEAFKTIPPGGRHTFEFVAKHPGVFMYHCATDPVLHHTGAGMVGAMIVKPKNLAPVDRELWINQQRRRTPCSDRQPRSLPRGPGGVHARRGGRLPVRHARLRRHGQGCGGSAGYRAPTTCRHAALDAAHKQSRVRAGGAGAPPACVRPFRDSGFYALLGRNL